MADTDDELFIQFGTGYMPPAGIKRIAYSKKIHAASNSDVEILFPFGGYTIRCTV